MNYGCEGFCGFGDAVRFVPTESGEVGEFAANAQGERSGCEILFGIFQTDSACGDEAAVREWSAQRFEMIWTAAAAARKNLDDVRAELQSRHYFARREGAWDGQHVVFCGSVNYLRC